MNLYQLHTNPEELDFHDEAHEKVPYLVWQKYRSKSKELKKREDVIAKSAEYSKLYAHGVLKKPFPKGEDAIAEDAKYSYFYAFDVLKAPFPKGEDVIAKDAEYSYQYARYVLDLPHQKAVLWGK